MRYTLSIFVVLILLSACKHIKDDGLEPPKTEIRYFLSIDDGHIDLNNIDHCGHHFDDIVSDGLDMVQSMITTDTKYPVKELVKFYHSNLPHETSKAEKQYQSVFKKILKANKLEHSVDNQLYVLEVNFINACLLLNRVYVTRALLDIANEHQLALILSHELGHYMNHFNRCYDVINQHYHYSRNPEFSSLVTSMSSSFFTKLLTFSGQSDELEADIAGLYICNNAGFDLEEGVSAYKTFLYEHTPTVFFEKFVGDWTRSHPYAEDRIYCLSHYVEPAKCEIRSDLLYEINRKSKSLKTTEIYAFPHLTSEKLDMVSAGELIHIGYMMFSQHEDWLYVKRLKTNSIGWIPATYVKDVKAKNKTTR